MNNFEARYIKISSEYLTQKMKGIHVRNKDEREHSTRKESQLQRFVTKLFQTKEE